MKSVHLFTVAVGMFACNHSGNTCAGNLKNGTTAVIMAKNTTAAPVVNGKKPVVNAAPEMPFFKDVLNSKMLFW